MIISAIDEYINKSSWMVNENANQVHSYAKLKGYIADKEMREYVLRKYPQHVVDLHMKAYIHIHDLSNGLTFYCSGSDLMVLLLRGLWTPQTVSGPPKHLASALDQLVNFFTAKQDEWAGAQAVGNFNTLLAPYVRKYKEELVEEGVSYDVAVKLTLKYVKQCLQMFIFNMNQQSRSSNETPFTNVIFDSVCPQNLADEPVHLERYGHLSYAEFDEESMMILQCFNEALSKGDNEGKPFTFPIPTINLVSGMDWDHPVWREVAAVEAKFGYYYWFNFIGSGIDSNTTQAMCCLSGETKIISSGSRGVSYKKIKEFKNSEDRRILVEGEFKPGHWFKTKTNKMYHITFANNQTVKMSDNHINVTKRGNVLAENLTTDDWLPWSLKGYDGEKGSYDLGRIVGLYIAEGCNAGKSKCFSFHPNETQYMSFIEEFVSTNFGANTTRSNTKGIGDIGATVLNVNSKTFANLMDEYVSGTTAITKGLKSKIFKMSTQFRIGVWDGWRQGDGSSVGRICTASPKLRDDACCLLASLGRIASIATDNRTREDGKLGDNPLYHVRYYSTKMSKYKNVFELEGDRIWIKVKNIEVVEGERTVYDFDMDTEEEIFQLANGLITHNCRLKIDLSQLPPAGGRWATAGGTGSLGIVSINMSKMGYLSGTEEELLANITDMMGYVREAIDVKEGLIQSTYENGLMPITEHYGIDFARYFRTIGVIGLHEMCMNFNGKPIWENTELVAKVLTHMREWTRATQKATGKLWNLEMTPGESASTRFAQYDIDNHPDIITQGTQDAPYYTTLLVPPSVDMDLFERMDVENDLLHLFTGGTVSRNYIGENSPDPGALWSLIRHIAEKSQIPYFDFAATFSICSSGECMYTVSGNVNSCPQCGTIMDVFQRITGYMRSSRSANYGKYQEIQDRKYMKNGYLASAGLPAVDD